MTHAWPARCTIADAARLFSAAGHPVDRSNVSRFVKSRGFAKDPDGRVDPTALFKAYTSDYGRQVMAGQTAAPIAPPVAPPTDPPLPGDEPFLRDDPKRHLARINATRAQLDLSRQLGETVPAEEVRAAIAEMIADLRAAMLQAAREEAARLLADLNAPSHMTGKAIAALKRYAGRGQEAFAARGAKWMADIAQPGGPARAHLDALVAYDLELRGDAADDEPDAPPQPARETALERAGQG